MTIIAVSHLYLLYDDDTMMLFCYIKKKMNLAILTKRKNSWSIPIFIPASLSKAKVNVCLVLRSVFPYAATPNCAYRI